MVNNPRILLLEGNLRSNCERAVANGTVSAADRYALLLKFSFPDIQIDKFYGAELDCTLPSGAYLTNYDGVVIGGSGLHAYHDEPAVTRQIDFVRSIFETGIPILGSCWGMQISVLAAGGAVEPSPLGRELGIARKVVLSEEGQKHPFFTGKSVVFDTPCIHLDEVTKIPQGAKVLASNDHSYVQALAFSYLKSDFWGVQYHPEFDLFHMASLAVMYSDIMLEGGFHNTMDEIKVHAEMMEALHADPSRFDLAWKLGIDKDVLDDKTRTLEISNWLEHKVLPYKTTRN